jgi:hypothetical protein
MPDELTRGGGALDSRGGARRDDDEGRRLAGKERGDLRGGNAAATDHDDLLTEEVEEGGEVRDVAVGGLRAWHPEQLRRGSLLID